jgi:hypothetical protein
MPINVKRAEIRINSQGRINLPGNCAYQDSNTIIYSPSLTADSDIVKSIFKQIKSHLLCELILNDKPFELAFKKWIVLTEEGIEREILFTEGSFTVGTKYFEAKPIQIGVNLFSFVEWNNNRNKLIDQISNWLNDKDLKYMIDTYNIGLFKKEEELFYMYSIYECMKYKDKKLGEKFIIEKLGLKNEDKRYIHEYCNKETIRNSRHSGRVSGKGDNASGTNLQKVRSIIKELIIRYAYYTNNAAVS